MKQIRIASYDSGKRKFYKVIIIIITCLFSLGGIMFGLYKAGVFESKAETGLDKLCLVSGTLFHEDNSNGDVPLADVKLVIDNRTITKTDGKGKFSVRINKGKEIMFVSENAPYIIDSIIVNEDLQDLKIIAKVDQTKLRNFYIEFRDTSSFYIAKSFEFNIGKNVYNSQNGFVIVEAPIGSILHLYSNNGLYPLGENKIILYDNIGTSIDSPIRINMYYETEATLVKCVDVNGFPIPGVKIEVNEEEIGETNEAGELPVEFETRSTYVTFKHSLFAFDECIIELGASEKIVTGTLKEYPEDFKASFDFIDNSGNKLDILFGYMKLNDGKTFQLDEEVVENMIQFSNYHFDEIYVALKDDNNSFYYSRIGPSYISGTITSETGILYDLKLFDFSTKSIKKNKQFISQEGIIFESDNDGNVLIVLSEDDKAFYGEYLPMNDDGSSVIKIEKDGTFQNVFLQKATKLKIIIHNWHLLIENAGLFIQIENPERGLNEYFELVLNEEFGSLHDDQYLFLIPSFEEGLKVNLIDLTGTNSLFVEIIEIDWNDKTIHIRLIE